MRDFKDSTKTQYAKGGAVGPKGAAKIAKVMGEFKRGTLHSGSGQEVGSRKQAIAIALSEARRRPIKKAEGGLVTAENITRRPERIGRTDEERVAERAMRSSAVEAAGDGLIARLPRRSAPAPKPAPKPQRDPREPLVKTPLMDKLTRLPSQRGEFRVKR